MSGVAQNLQAFILNIAGQEQNLREQRELREEDYSEDPYHQRSTSQGGGYQSDRSRPKQVRFDIKQGLMQMVDAATTGENSHQLRTLSSDGGNENANPNAGLDFRRVKKLKPERRLKFVKPPISQERNPHSDNSHGRKQSHSPQNARRGQSNDTNKTSDSQKPRKIGKSKQNIELALKYKRNADEMRRKRQGIDAPSSIVMDETQYSSAISDAKHFQDESRETPNFSLAVSRRDLDGELSPETPPRPMEHRPMTIHVPHSIETEQSYEEINHSSGRKPVQQYGAIVRNTSQPKLQQSYQLSSSRNSSIQGGRPLAGMIIRQASPSHHSISMSQIGGVRSSHQVESGKFIKVAQIVRNQSQLIRLPQHQLQYEPLTTDQEASFSQLQIDSERNLPQSSLVSSLRTEYVQHSFGTFWDILQEEPANAKNKLLQLKEKQNSTRAQLLQVLSTRGLKIYQKLSVLRSLLPQLVHASLSDNGLKFLEMKGLRDTRQRELQVSYKKYLKTNSIHETIKSQLLSDIVARLNQKLALSVMRMHAKLMSHLRQQFDAYYVEYICSDIKRFTLGMMKTFVQSQGTQREDLTLTKQHLQKNKLTLIISLWRNHIMKKRTLLEQHQMLEASLSLMRLKTYLKRWREALDDQQREDSAMSLVTMFIKHKYRDQVFLKWIHGLRQTNKIKRKALQMVSSTKSGRADHGQGSVNDEQYHLWALKRIKESFNHHIEEFQRNFNRHKEDIKPQQRLNRFALPPSTSKKTTCQQAFSLERDSDFRKSMDVNLKYNIHNALVAQQNSQTRGGGSASSYRAPLNGSRERRQEPYHFISSGQKPRQTQMLLNQRLNNYEANRPIKTQAPAPNELFKMLEEHNQRNKPNQSNLSIAYDDAQGIPLDEQLRNHIQYLTSTLRLQAHQPYHFNFVRSLRVHAQNCVENTDDFTTLTDYIQFGLAQSQPGGEIFRDLFQTKVRSLLFSKWRQRYLSRQRDKALSDLHLVNIGGKQVLREWQRHLIQKKLWVKEFQRTKTMQRFYRIFREWCKWNRQEVYLQVKQVRAFRKKIVFQGWLRYLDDQGHVLMKIIQAQRYHSSALLSKSMLGLYQHYLKQLRVKRFQRQHAFKRYFKGKWMKKYARNTKLRSILNKRESHLAKNERVKYQIEYDIKRDIISQWRDRVEEKQEAIQDYTADTHFRQQLIAKTFFRLKSLFSVAKGVQRLHILALVLSVKPAFERMMKEQNHLMQSESKSKDYRRSFLIARTFNAWKGDVIKNKLANLFLKRKYMRRISSFVAMKNHTLPIQYRQRRLMFVFMVTLRRDCQAKWQDNRGNIILRQLTEKRNAKLVKRTFLNFLHYLLQGKQKRMMRMYVETHKNSRLCDKAFRLLKRRWLKRKKRRLMGRVAQDFNQSLRLRKEEKLKESLLSITSDFDVIRLRDQRVLDDQDKLTKYRVVALWKMYVQERLRKTTVLDRYLLFKRRMVSLRCFLAWRSIAKYEHSSKNGSSTYRETHLATTREQSPQHQRRIASTDRTARVNSVRFADQSQLDTREYLFDPRLNTLASNESLSQGGASATFGQRSLASHHERVGETPSNMLLQSSNSFQGNSSLFGELEAIFTKNRKWLDEQREREEFLREMASHYNQRLSSDMQSIRRSSMLTSSFNSNPAHK